MTLCGGGSSIALSSALEVRSSIRSASSISVTCQRPWLGRCEDSRMISRDSLMLRVSPSGTTTVTSGWVPPSAVWQAWQCPQPASGHCSAAASARAAIERPEPGGPVNSHAWLIAPVLGLPGDQPAARVGGGRA